MLHIILGILKFIGIAVGILLLVLAAFLLCIIFVPLRYHIQVVKKPGQIKAKIKASWLLRIIQGAIQFTPGDGIQIAIRILGFRLPFFGGNKPHETASEKTQDTPEKSELGEPQNTSEKPDSPEMQDDLEKNSDSVEMQDISEENTFSEEAEDLLGETVVSEKIQDIPEEKIVSEKVQDTPEEKTVSEKVQDTPEETVSEKVQDTPEEKTVSEKVGLKEKIRFYFIAVYDKIIKIFHLIKNSGNILRKLQELVKKPAELMQKLKRQMERLQGVFDLLEEYEANKALQDLLGYLRYLLVHFRPRRIKGYLTFGTGDPAQSAQLTGVLYLLLPSGSDQFTINTEFTDIVFETETDASGHIRIYHLLRILWQVFRNRRIRKLISLRKKAKILQK